MRMTYKIVSYQDLTPNENQIFFEFLKEARNEITQPAHENMWDDGWANNPATLPHLLEKTNRFTESGKYHIAFDDDTIVGCSGVYTSSFCPDLAIAGTRTWINKDYRNLSIARELLLPIEKAWAIEKKFKAIAICFNDYNKNLIKLWQRIRLGEKRTPRQSHHLFYNGVNELEFPVTIQYTKQWVMYEKLDPSFEFDWYTIR
jgi:hypothetical protein